MGPGCFRQTVQLLDFCPCLSPSSYNVILIGFPLFFLLPAFFVLRFVWFVDLIFESKL
jgi:hypothetical protein